MRKGGREGESNKEEETEKEEQREKETGERRGEVCPISGHVEERKASPFICRPLLLLLLLRPARLRTRSAITCGVPLEYL